MRGIPNQARGLSLIEALLALAVMGFGMLAVVGLQSTLRQNGDQSRQRTEALRLAQDAVEQWRSYSVLDTTTDRMAYQDIVTPVGDETITGANASYTLRRTVSIEDAVPGADSPKRRLLTVQVIWRDRTDQEQRVVLSSMINETAPELAATLALASDASPVRRPLGRHRAIPVRALDLGGGRSGYVPPGQSGFIRVAWSFDNVTGLITLCTTTATNSAFLTTSNLTCGTDLAQFIGGYVRYATLGTQPMASDLVDPQGPSTPGFTLRVLHTEPVAGTTNCFVRDFGAYARYQCAVPVLPLAKAWTGALQFGAPLSIAGSIADFDATTYKVCRYHANATYTAVAEPLADQNFVVIRSGTGVAPGFTCPSSGTPRSWPHQPAT